MEDDPIVRALNRSSIAQTLKAARASLKEPSRPFTPLDRSLFQLPDNIGDQSCFGIRDVSTSGCGVRPESSHSSKSSKAPTRPDTIREDGCNAYFREGNADVLSLDTLPGRNLSCGRRHLTGQIADGVSSDGEELTPMSPAMPSPPLRTPNRPPKPPGPGGYPLSSQAAPALRPQNATPMEKSSRRLKSRSPSPRNRVKAASASAGEDWDHHVDQFLDVLRDILNSREKRKIDFVVEICEQAWTVVQGIQEGRGTSSQTHAVQLLKAIMALLDVKDLKDVRVWLKFSRSVFALLRVEGVTNGFPISGVQQAYMSLAQGLFKYSQKGEHDHDFQREGLIEPMLSILKSDAAECSSSDLLIYVTGVLKNVSNDERNQRLLVEQDGVATLFRLLSGNRLTGCPKEAKLLIQVTATLRNVCGKQHLQFLLGERLDALTNVMALFPSHVELLTNVARILAKLTLHADACEAFGQNSERVNQISRTLNSNPDAAPLVLRLAFVLGNLTERSEHVRVVLAYSCEGTVLLPQLLCNYWKKDRHFARSEISSENAAKVKEVEEVLVKLVRLLANVAISASVGVTLASSSAVADPLLDMLGAKRIDESEELVLNTAAAVTNLLFYDVPSNLLFQEENKALLCRLFRPLLLESYNVEALIETARALGNLSRHQDSRLCMTGLRIDEALVILLDHDDRDLVFYVCGALVNVAADPQCTDRLIRCNPIVSKLAKLLKESPRDDLTLQLVAVKVLTNLSLDSSIRWVSPDAELIRNSLDDIILNLEDEYSDQESPGTSDKQQLTGLCQQLSSRLPPNTSTLKADVEATPALSMLCTYDGCTRRFESEEKLLAHVRRRHAIENV